ncbi:aldehyde dehydrogenase family protein [Planktomarina temperata]|nr:aldehyde dehydrogenase family protein [Planktomarina temperata]
MPDQPYQARHFIDGKIIDSADGRTSDRISPSHGVLASQAALGTAKETEAAISAARRAFDDGRWSQLSGKDRATVLNKVADLIEANEERLAVLETLESGKPISQSRGECGGAADLWRYAASLARTSLRPLPHR